MRAGGTPGQPVRGRCRVVLLGLLVLFAAAAGAGDEGDAERQAELDRRCETARDRELAPIRTEIYEDCLADRKGDDAYCRNYADGYNGERIGGSPRFYELPECEEAFRFRNRNRNRKPGT